MRIISGQLRSRRLVFPRTRKTRPMTDRAKETIFNILGESVVQASVLDLFAGSGSLGLEALSRGASDVTFVDKGPWALRSIRENLKRLGLQKKAFLSGRGVFPALKIFEREGRKFSLVFLDPPYNKGLVKKILLRLDPSDIVTPLTQLVLHRSRQEKLPEDLEKLHLLREKQMGQSCLSFLSRRG